MKLTRHLLVVIVAVLSSATAGGELVSPAIPLETLASRADVVLKVTAIADRPASDPWFEPAQFFELRETEFRIVSIVKGDPGAPRMVFRHYAPTANSPAAMSMPQHYRFEIGRTYLVFASATGDAYRQIEKRATAKSDQGAMLAADDRPHRGATVTEAVWSELTTMLAGSNSDNAIYAISQLDSMSGGGFLGAQDFARPAVFEAVRPLLLSSNESIASAAIELIGRRTPYFDDNNAPYWLATLGAGTIPGIGGRELTDPPAASAVEALLAVAESGASSRLRALAIRTLGRAARSEQTAAWIADASPLVRSAAVMTAAANKDRAFIARGGADAAPEVRRSAALAVGFTQQRELLPLIGTLLNDAEPDVREAAALALMSFPLTDAEPLMHARLDSNYGPLFVNALSRRDPAPFLLQLARVVEEDLTPSDWWGGTIPAADSWRILFDYAKGRPAQDLAEGRLDSTLDALERLKWFSSSEPQQLYALYLARGLQVRAKRFREEATRAIRFDMKLFFDQAEKSPSTFL